MTKAERKLCDSLVYARKEVSSIFDSFMLEHIGKGRISNEEFERFKDRVDSVVEERMQFIKHDLELLQKEKEAEDDDSCKDAS